MGTMTSKKINANPTKEFFVEMITRDILLKQAIIELIDNSIDGARRQRRENNEESFSITVDFDETHFRITDNCGGIPIETARKYAFRFGRTQDDNRVGVTTGIFGIGMKRAVFKMGNTFEVKSRTKTSYFEMKVDISEWLKIDTTNWDFEFSVAEEKLQSEGEGTTITVTELYDEIKNSFSSTLFANELIHDVERRMGEELHKGVKILINGKQIEGNYITLYNNQIIEPVKEEFEFQGVRVKIVAGIAPKDPGEKRNAPEKAGWYIYCNGRQVVSADKTGLTTWKDVDGINKEISYNNTYASFRGMVFFESENPEKLPWNTTKTGIDESSFVYIHARERMREIFKIVKGAIDKMSTEMPSDTIGIIDLDENDATSVVITQETVSNNLQPNKTIIKTDIEKKPKKTTISYKMDEELVSTVKKEIGAKTNKEVGEKTFYYYTEAEL